VAAPRFRSLRHTVPMHVAELTDTAKVENFRRAGSGPDGFFNFAGYANTGNRFSEPSAMMAGQHRKATLAYDCTFIKWFLKPRIISSAPA